MARKNIGAYIIFSFAIVLCIGCSGDGTFERPDSFEVTTPEAVHGQIGHRATIMAAKEGEEIVRQLVLVVRDGDVSAAPIYIVMGYSSGAPYAANQNTIDMVELIDYLYTAASVALVPSLPEGITQKGGILYGGGGTLLCYLRVQTPSETLYWSLQSSQEQIDKVFEWLAKPPEVLNTLPATVTEISYYSDSDLTMPLIDETVVGSAVYTKVVFSKDVPIVFADDGPSQPSISSAVRSEEFQYRMRSWDTDLQSGDAKPYRDSKNSFVCKYEVRTNDFGGRFRTYVGHHEIAGAALHITVFRYTGEIPANIPETITDWQPNDFVGRVYTATPSWEERGARPEAVPIAGVTVTIVSGPRQGESTVTDKNGRYRFLNVRQDELHLRTEKNHFEPKEAIVHRYRPLSLPDGSVPNHPADPQKTPGNILIGQVWPEEVRPLLKEVLLVHDLLYVQGNPLGENIRYTSGYYINGLIAIFSNDHAQATVLLTVIEHEIAHAHQHAVVSVDGSGGGNYWKKTPEGKAYAEAWQKDLDLGRKMYYDLPDSYFASTIKENAAEHCANYWGEKRGVKSPYRHSNQLGKTLEELAPNRYRWAEEWLTKK